jgi:hypothetical protein
MEQATRERPSPGKDERLAARQRELLAALKAARDELGRWPGGREWERASAARAASRTYIRHFGSWAQACQAAEEIQGRTKLSG